MNIGIDIDNVISNFDEVLLEEYFKHDKELRNTGIINEETYMTKGMFDWSEEEERKFYLDNIESIAKSLNTKDGAKKYIDKLKQDGHNIFIITGRDNGEYTNPVEMTKKWLNENQIYYDKLILTNAYKNDKHGKTEKCLENNIDIMIDDSINICKDINEHGIKAIIMDTPYNRNTNGFERVHSWKEIYKYIKKKNNNLSKLAKTLIIDQSIGKVISIFLDVFLAAYFYKITEQNILYLSIYNIVGWIVATIGAFVVSNYIKKKDKIKLYRFGIIIKSLYIFMIIVMGEKIIKFVYLIGAMYGISTATTGFPFNMIESECINQKERKKYIGLASVFTEIISFVVPIILGAYITLKSYQVAAIIILLFSIIKIINSFNIKNINVQSSNIRIRDFASKLKKDKILKKLYIIEFLKGINRYGVMSLVVSLLIIYNTKNEFELGWISSLLSLCSILAMYIFAKAYKDKYKKFILCFSLVFLFVSFALVMNNINMNSIILYNISYYIFMNIILKITEVNLFDYSNKKEYKDKYNTEYFIFRELFLNIGRILGYILLLIFVGFSHNLNNLKIIFIFIIISIIGAILLSNSIDEKNW